MNEQILHQIVEKLSLMDEKMNKVDERITQLDGKVERLDGKVIQLDEKVDLLKNQVAENTQLIKAVRDGQEELNAHLIFAN